ncbi:Vacuolar protein sorting-associated protein 37A [Boothiomyces sp. JEL0838]|nr:Vacuolar protein sorting-associated protein 37A [Boothiomyces sp. JEL0838]
MASLESIRTAQIESLKPFSPTELGKSYYQIVAHLPSQIVHIQSFDNMQKEEFPELDGKTSEEIEEILLDDNAFADYFYTLDQVKPIKQMQDDLLVNNAEIAKSNLSRKDQIEDLKKRIHALQNINAEHRKQLDQLLYEQQQELTRFGSEYLTEQLRQLVATSDDMTELSAASFLEGKLSEDEFIKAFKESRKLYHLRNAKLENLTK